MPYGRRSDWEKIKNLSPKYKVIYVLMLICVVLSVIGGTYSIPGMNQIIAYNGRSPFQLFIVIGLILNIIGNFILAIAAQEENNLNIDSEQFFKFGFLIGAISWGMLIINNSYGIYWIQMPRLQAWHLFFLLGPIYMWGLTLLLSIYGSNPGLIFFWSYEVLFIALCVLGVIALVALQTDYFGTEGYGGMKFSTCPHCHKMIVEPGNFCIHCGKSVDKKNE